MNKISSSYKFISLIVSIAIVCFSIFIIIQPEISVLVAIISLGSIVLIDGLLHIISYFRKSREERTISIELIRGILSSLIGLMIIINPVMFSSFLPIIIGIWIVIQSIVKLQFAFTMKAVSEKNWIIVLLLSIITLLLGLFIIFNPFSIVVALTTICGIILLISEILNIIEIILVMISNK